MGFWNETCLLTGLPILEGEPVVAFLIAQVPVSWSTTYCHPCHTHAPLTLPFFGKYDGHGCLDNIIASRTAVSCLDKLPLCRLEEESLPVFLVHAPITEVIDKQKLFSLAVSTKLSIPVHQTDDTTRQKPVHLCMMKQEFYDIAINNPDIKIWTKTKRPDLKKQVHPALLALSQDISAKKAKKMIRLNYFMDYMRIAWHPTCGTGFTNRIDHEWQYQFYQKIAEMAHSLHEQTENY